MIDLQWFGGDQAAGANIGQSQYMQESASMSRALAERSKQMFQAGQILATEGRNAYNNYMKQADEALAQDYGANAADFASKATAAGASSGASAASGAANAAAGQAGASTAASGGTRAASARNATQAAAQAAPGAYTQGAAQGAQLYTQGAQDKQSALRNSASLSQGVMNAGLGQQSSGLQGEASAGANMASNASADQERLNQEAANKQQRENANIQGAWGAGGEAIGVLGSIFASDERIKDKEPSSGSPLDDYLSKVGAYFYRYKPEAQEQMPEATNSDVNYGPMAQDLEQSPATESAVEETEDGTKVVDTQRLSLANSGLLVELGKRLQALEEKMAS